MLLVDPLISRWRHEEDVQMNLATSRQPQQPMSSLRKVVKINELQLNVNSFMNML